MGTYEELKAAIQQVITTNGNNEITGALLQQTLLSIVNSVGVNAMFAGIAIPSTNPGTPDQNVFYFATTEGTYVNFGGISVENGESVILTNKTGYWLKQKIGLVTEQQIQELANNSESKFLELIGEAQLNIPSSGNGRFYYEIPKLSNGETYEFTFTLKDASEGVIYWTIRVNKSFSLFNRDVLNAGSIEAVVTKELTEDYNFFELEIYSAINIPDVIFTINKQTSIISEIQDNINQINDKATTSLTIAQNAEKELLDITDRKVGNFYKDAWVRYSDGLIAESLGGAKCYIIKKSDVPNATKIIARVCTQHKEFAAIAFYSDDIPSTSSYMKDSSVEGKASNDLNDFVADIPENCKSIIVLNMSQLQTDYEIRVNETEYIKRGEVVAIENKSLFNPFSVKNQYYHFNVETAANNTFIPSQSLFDIEFAARLGFEIIEANAQMCSDGVFITKHGIGGNFGNGIKSNNGIDYSSIPINSISSAEVREHITYDSRFPKYNVPIPTLEEFCQECKKYNLGIKVNYVAGLLPILRKYFTDDRIFISAVDRGDFKGLMEIIYYPSQGIEVLEEKCNRAGWPLQVIIASGQFESMSDDSVREIVQWCHERNYTISVAYMSTSNWLRAQSLGVDVNLSCERTINRFNVGNDKNIISLQDDNIVLGAGIVYEDDLLIMQNGSVLEIPADNIRFGAVSLDICYDGMITMYIGHGTSVHSVVDRSGDGISTLSISQAIFPKNGAETTDIYVKIFAKAVTTIKSLSVRCSKL